MGGPTSSEAGTIHVIVPQDEAAVQFAGADQQDRLDPEQRVRSLRSFSDRKSQARTKSVAATARKIHDQIQQVHADRKKQSKQRRRNVFTSALSEEEQLAEKLGHKHWRCKLLKVLQSKYVQLVLTVLLVLDIIIVLGELFVDAEYPSCARIRRDAISCGPANASARLLGGSADDPICKSPWVPKTQYDAGCDGHKYPAVHSLHTFAFIASATILCIFEVELLATLTALGTIFIKNPLYVLDFGVVTASLVLDFHLHLGNAASGESGATILIVARCWRFIRVVHGIYASSHERDMESLKEVTETARELAMESEELDKEVDQLQKTVEEMIVELEKK